MQSLDITTLPEPVFFTTGFDQILASCKTAYEQTYREKTGQEVSLEETDREMIILRVFAYRENLFRINANEAAKKNLLAYSDGTKLDHLGAFFHVTRLPARKAMTVLRFTFQETLPIPLLISSSIKIKTADNKLTFSITHTTSIPRGSIFYDLEAECTTPGAEGNEYTPGTILNLVTPLPYVDSVTNTIASKNGADPESDDNFRERIYLKPDSISTTGSEDAYIFWTRSAHQDIKEVAVTSPRPGVITIYPLLQDGILPDFTMLELILDSLNNEKIKTFTDRIEVSTPELISITITIELTLYKSYVAMQEQIKQKAEEEAGVWAKEQIKLGKDIVPEQLSARIQAITGIYRTIVVSPEYRELDIHQFGKVAETGITITGDVDE